MFLLNRISDCITSIYIYTLEKKYPQSNNVLGHKSIGTLEHWGIGHYNAGYNRR